MHSDLLSHVTESQLREFAVDTLSMVKETNRRLYDALEWHLYHQIYGCHFSDFLLEKALNTMVNTDNTKGSHWTLEQTNQLARQLGIAFKDYNQYDFCYTINMLYSDYYNTLNTTDSSMYGKLAKAFLEDKDAPEGKALKYYKAMQESPNDDF